MPDTRKLKRVDLIFTEDCSYKDVLKNTLQRPKDEIIQEMLDSGLRGRGGAGFPTGLKWKFTGQEEDPEKYVVCNADEGEPGTFKDREILVRVPYKVFGGMAVCGHVIGAKKGYMYLRGEYEFLKDDIQQKLDDFHKVLDELGVDFRIKLLLGSGAYICGEESALFESMEGKRGEPRPRPPFPAQSGLWDMPTVLNNVETYANVSSILLFGGDWFASHGTDKSKGTKIFALAGAINNSGLFEVPIGTNLGDLVYDIGGGTSSGKPFKAAQIGGPSGGCIPKQHLNVKLDYESLNELGAIMGSGGLIVMDEDSCMVDVAKFFLDFVQEESCGKCTPCRVGTKRMYEILDRITSGKGEEGDVEKLIELGNYIKKTALCGLGQSAPNPVLSTIRYFRHEYDAHINEKKCHAGTCPD